MLVAGVVLADEAHHTVSPPHVLLDNRPICYLEALNAVVTITTRAARLRDRYICIVTMLLLSWNGRGKDQFLQILF